MRGGKGMKKKPMVRKMVKKAVPAKKKMLKKKK
jgi:hypothetical protein